MRGSVADRLHARITIVGDCWEWSGSRNAQGYGTMLIKGRCVLTHRVMAAMTFGMFDRRLCVLHRCDNPPCCNPDHLFLGDRKDNRLDQISKGRDPNVNKTHCKQGHEFPPSVGPGRRVCPECSRIKALAYYHRTKKLRRVKEPA